MLRSGLILFASFGLGVAWGADATSPVDYKQRNTPYAPAATVDPATQTPTANASVQKKRVATPMVEKSTATAGEQRAAMKVGESRDKTVVEKNSHRPESRDRELSGFDQRRARISTSDTTRPPTVAKYQDSLTAASATNMARFPAMDRATTAKINRFVFRKNPTDATVPAAATAGASAASERPTVTPAAGGSVIRK